MDDKPLMSWAVLFGVTACSGFVFSMIIKMMDGDHSPFLLKIGLVSGIFWALNRLYFLFKKTPAKKSQHS